MKISNLLLAFVAIIVALFVSVTSADPAPEAVKLFRHTRAVGRIGAVVALRPKKPSTTTAKPTTPKKG